ncbi:MAG: nucleotidyltransferase family protein [Acidobacteria bacterium]|nr:nucleotidyltransferase family protein [Acidobacteriota bacterium]
MVQLPFERDRIAAFCRRNHICLLALFGSVVRQDFRPDSDVDVLIDFAEGLGPGFIGLHRIETELSELLGGRRLDLVNPRYLNPRIRDQVLAEAVVQYAEG